MVVLENNCSYIITDSGGVQPEAHYLKKKCIIMRTETEWKEQLLNNNNILYDYKTPLYIFIKEFLKINIKNEIIDTNVSKKIINIILKVKS